MSDEAIEAARRIEAQFDGRSVHTIDVGDIRLVARALLSREAERDAVIEECAKVADEEARRLNAESIEEKNAGREEYMYRVNFALHHAWEIAKKLRSLKTACQPSADGGKEKP